MGNNYSDYVSVYISDDEMGADIFLVDTGEEDFYNIDDLKRFVEEQGVVFGINENVLEEIISEGKYGDFVHFADGMPPGEPRNGYYDFKFNINPTKTPKLRDDGSVDYYNLNLVEVVQKDQVIAEYITKQDGSNGMTVTGAYIEGKKASDLPPLRGKGFYVSEDKLQYFAEIDGKAELNMGALNVSSMHIVTGDVDLSTGHINFRGDLEITGSIRADMEVKATGNITVGGLVEAANIEAGKDLLIKGGILGGSKANIKAGGNVYALFIENATVESNASVQADSIINSNVSAYVDINVFGKSSSIVGGKLKANRYVKTKNIGSMACVTTEIEVGVPNDCQAERKKYADDLSKLENELEKVETLIDKMLESGNSRNEMFTHATRTKIELSAEIFRMRSIIKGLDDRLMIGRNAEISAENKVHQGTRIMIDGLRYNVEDEYEKILFFRKKDKILSRKIDDEEEAEKMEKINAMKEAAARNVD